MWAPRPTNLRAVGHHGPGRRRSPDEAPDPTDQVGQTGTGQGEQTDVVLAQVGPPGGRVREGLDHPGPEAAGGSGVARQPDHPDPGLEGRIVETADTVDHDHDPVGTEPFDIDQRAGDVPGQPRSHVGEDHGGDMRRVPAPVPVGPAAGGAADVHGALTALG